ncbi:MAG: sugar phosphate nucleotidyltransferase [bacterium]
MVKPPVCMILAGGRGTRLNALAWHRAKPAVPFGGIYRLIDFTLSNAMNSGIMRIGVLTQYLPLSLMGHIGTGISWDMSARTRECRILPPAQGATAKDWYKGTAHAIAVNKDFIDRGGEKDILILSGDHIYQMDYGPLIQFHRENKARFTIATMPVLPSEASRFGIAVIDAKNRVLEFQEKPLCPKGNLGSMGIYVADRDVVLEQMSFLVAGGKTDIGADLVPRLVSQGGVFAFPFKGYWRDVGTLESYWDSSMDLLCSEEKRIDLHRWNIRTNMEATGLSLQPPARFSKCSQVTNSFISQGCQINGRVHHSILSPGVIVEKGAEVVDSVLLDDVIVKKNCRVFRVIADKYATIGERSELIPSEADSPNTMFPNHLYNGITLLGTRSVVPADSKMKGNCLVYPDIKVSDWATNILQAGETISSKTEKDSLD